MKKMSDSEVVVAKIIHHVTKNPETNIRLRIGLSKFANSIDFLQADADEIVNCLTNLKTNQLNIIFKFITGDITEQNLLKKAGSFNVSNVFKKKNEVKKEHKNIPESYEVKRIYRESSDGEIPFLLQE